MDISGAQKIPAGRQQVWEALNDPRVLQACIPGCQVLTAKGGDAFDAEIQVKVGPVKALFKGTVELSDIKAPESYVLKGGAKGGLAGMANGAARVNLEEIDANTTNLTYDVDVDIGGRLAQVGSRLLQSTINRYTRDFFGRFEQIITNQVSVDDILADRGGKKVSTSKAKAVESPTRAIGGEIHPVDDRARRDAEHIRKINWGLIAVSLALVAYEIIRVMVTRS